jgi:hypothetical protein
MCSGKLRDRRKLNLRPRLWYHARRHLLYQFNHKTQVIWKGRGGLLCYSPTFPLLHTSRGCWRCLLPLRCDRDCGSNGR